MEHAHGKRVKACQGLGLIEKGNKMTFEEDARKSRTPSEKEPAEHRRNTGNIAHENITPNLQCR